MAFLSTFADLYGEVIAKVRLDATDDLQRTKDWINQVYAEVCVETEFLQDFDTMTLIASEPNYTLDAQVIRIKQMYVTPSGQGPSRPLQPTTIEQILEWSASNGATPSNQGSVTHYALVGSRSILLYPTPSAADVVTMYYAKLPTALSAAADVPILQEPYVTECLVNGACFKAAVFLKDPDASLFKQLYDASVAKLRGHLRRKEGSMTKQFRITRGTSVAPHDPSTDAWVY